MATLDMAAKLAVLDEARRRLEAELERDEHWRALQKPVAATDADELASEKDARDRRLRLALEANPVYVAWRNVVEASATLRKTSAIDSEFEGLIEPAPSAPEAPKTERTSLSAALRDVLADGEATETDEAAEDNSADILPPEIAALIRAEVNAASATSQLSDSDRELHAVGERAARAVEKLLAIPSVEPVAPEQLETARRADRLANELREINERRRVRALQTDENEIVTETAPTERRASLPSDAEDDTDFNPAGAPWMPFDGLGDPEEKVATVMKRPEPQPGEPEEVPLPRRGSLVERLRAEETSAPAPPVDLGRTQRLSVTHEAEVTVVRKTQAPVPEPQDAVTTIATAIAQHPPLQDHKAPQRPFRRLINVITGK